jgi:hypothetical protein
MAKKHIEFLLWDEEGLALVDEVVRIDKEASKLYKEAFKLDGEKRDAKMSEYYVKVGEAKPTISKLEERYYIDEDLDGYGSINEAFSML